MGRRSYDTSSTTRGADLGAWVSTDASAHLRGRVARDTGPELVLRRRLHAAGLRFRLHPALGEGLTADLAFPAARMVVFVDGCFWHGCTRHARWTPTGPNAERWIHKFARTRERDEIANRLAEEQGLYPVRVWECEIREDVDDVVERLSSLVISRRDSLQTHTNKRADTSVTASRQARCPLDAEASCDLVTDP